MQYIITVGLIFVGMLTAPFLKAVRYAKKEMTPLHIEQGQIRDPRYFGKSFSKMIEKNQTLSECESVYLSKEEKFIDAGAEILEEKADAVVDEVIICLNKDLIITDGIRVVLKEIYGKENVRIDGKGVSVRAVYAKKKLMLNDNTNIVRWADAEMTLAVYDNCRLGISATAGKMMSVGNNCTFHRLYAPLILIGQYPDDAGYSSFDVDKSRMIRNALKTVRDIKYVDSSLLNDNHEADITVISRHSVVVPEGIILKGDLRSHGCVKICDNAVVCGNIFAEGDIHMGAGVVAGGNIFSQSSIVCEDRVVVGSKGSIVSMIARKHIIFEGRTMLYGYAGCEGGGRVSIAGAVRSDKETVLDNEETDIFKREYLNAPDEIISMEPVDVKAYEEAMLKGYRKTANLVKAVIPSEAAIIPDSMFFSCEALREVYIAATVTTIGEYAFMDCVKLTTVTSFADTRLERIGTSAYENCVGLEKLEFPKSLRYLGNAAFAGCVGIKSVGFAKECGLLTVGDHCFRDCRGIERIELPDSVKTVGVSAFAGCESLRYISVPSACAEEPGIRELMNIDGIEVLVRDDKCEGCKAG